MIEKNTQFIDFQIASSTPNPTRNSLNLSSSDDYEFSSFSSEVLVLVCYLWYFVIRDTNALFETLDLPTFREEYLFLNRYITVCRNARNQITRVVIIVTRFLRL